MLVMAPRSCKHIYPKKNASAWQESTSNADDSWLGSDEDMSDTLTALAVEMGGSAGKLAACSHAGWLFVLCVRSMGSCEPCGLTTAQSRRYGGSMDGRTPRTDGWRARARARPGFLSSRSRTETTQATHTLGHFSNVSGKC